MKTEQLLTAREIEIAEKLLNEIEDSGRKEYAEFLGLDSPLDVEIQDLTVEQLADAAEITIEEAQVFVMAISISEEGTLFGAIRALSEIVNNA